MSQKLRIHAQACGCIDASQSRMSVEICIPGARRKAIALHMNDNQLSLSAPRADFEYVSSARFCQPVESSQAHATYRKGLLHIDVPLRSRSRSSAATAVS